MRTSNPLSLVVAAVAVPLVAASTHRSLRSLNSAHRHLAVRDVLIDPTTELVTTTDGTPISSLPSANVDATANSTTVLVPVDPSTVSRVDSALPNPSKEITLYYAEKTYTDQAHYRSVIDWTLNWPGLVVGDAPEIDSFTCGANGKVLTFNDEDAFDEALGWEFPLVLVTEDPLTGCSYEDPDAPQYNPVHIRSIASSDREKLTITLRGYKSYWPLEASYHDVSIGFNPHPERVLNETAALSKRSLFDPWTYQLLSNMNYNSSTRGALVPTIPIYKGKYEKGPFEGEVDVECQNCYVEGSMIITVETGSSVGNAALNVVAAVVSLTDQAITEAKQALATVGNAAASATAAVLGTLGDAAKTIVDTLQSNAAAALKAGASDIEALFSTATSELSSAVSSAKSEISDLLDDAGEVVGDIAGALGDAADTIKDGVSSAIDYIGDKIGGLFGGWWKREFVSEEERNAAIDRFFKELGDELTSENLLNYRKNRGTTSFSKRSTGSDLFKAALAESSTLYKDRDDGSVLRKRGMVKRDGTAGYVGLKGGLNATVDVDVTLAGKLLAEFNKTLATYGIPELQIPDVVVVGPYLKLDSTAEVSIAGNVTFSTGASLAWNGIDMKVSTSDEQSMQELPMPTYSIHNSTYNVNEISLSAGIYILPKVVVGLNLIAANQELSGGLGLKFGLVNKFELGNDNCTSGVEYSIDVTGGALALYTVPRAIVELIGEDDPEKDYSIYEADPIHLYQKCFPLSEYLCSPGEVFDDSKLQCAANSTEPGDSTVPATNSTSTPTTGTTILPVTTSASTSVGLGTSTATVTSPSSSSSSSSSSVSTARDTATTTTARSTSPSGPATTTTLRGSSTTSVRSTSTRKTSTATTKARTTTSHSGATTTKNATTTTTKRVSTTHKVTSKTTHHGSSTKKTTTTSHKTTSTKKPATTTKKASSTSKRATSTTKRVETTRKPTSTKKPATTSKHSTTTTTRAPPLPSSSPGHVSVKNASLYAGWTVQGDNLTCTLTADIMACIGSCQRRSGCVAIDWGYRDGSWKCCLKRNVDSFKVEGQGAFHNVVLLDGHCSAHAQEVPKAMTSVCDDLDVK
ncbi:hypothetical protein JCM10212_005365 [Sporobolomyces blumeae]